MAAFVELFMDQGSTFSYTITLENETNNSNVNVSGYIVSSQIRRSYLSPNATANITCTITDATNGIITLSMTAANTANIKGGRYLFDVETITPANTVERILEGLIIVTPQITR